ncbi:MAG: hypothetical protein ACK4MX_07840 [Thermaurantiacus sp.]
MRTSLAAIAAALALAATPGDARPVSWPGGVTLIQELDPKTVSGLVHYTPNRHWSLGGRLMHMRDEQWSAAGLQATWLVRRWNMPSAQANLYLSGMAGGAWETGAGANRSVRPAAFVQAQGDWEDRRFMVMGLGRVTSAGHIGTEAMAMGRAGFAPFVADYGAVHLWLFGELAYRTEGDDRWQPALVARIFYRTMLLEAGVTDRGGLILNSQFRF